MPKKISVRLSDDVARAVEEMAVLLEVSVSEIVRMALMQFLAQITSSPLFQVLMERRRCDCEECGDKSGVMFT